MNKFKLMILFLLIIFIVLILFGCVPKEEIKIKEEVKEPNNTEETTMIPADKETDNNNYEVITESKYFEFPDKITVFCKGKTTTLERDTELYNNIIYLTDRRLGKVKDFGVCECMVDEGMITYIKNNKIALEFIYSKEIKTIFENKSYPIKFEKTYTRLFFPLTYEYSDDYREEIDWIFFGDDKEYYPGPIGPLPVPDDLVTLIDKEL